MCIRDRNTLDALIAGAAEAGDSLAGAEAGAAWAMAREVHPVSYTHLRAHETVLDLVCRLLLEKKKY